MKSHQKALENHLIVGWLPISQAGRISNRRAKLAIDKFKLLSPKPWMPKSEASSFDQIGCVEPVKGSHDHYLVGARSGVMKFNKTTAKLEKIFSPVFSVEVVKHYNDLILVFCLNSPLQIIRDGHILWQCKEKLKPIFGSCWNSYSRMVELLGRNLYFIAENNEALIYINLEKLSKRIIGGKATPDDYLVLDKGLIDISPSTGLSGMYYLKRDGSIHYRKRKIAQSQQKSRYLSCLAYMDDLLLVGGSNTAVNNNFELFNTRGHLLSNCTIPTNCRTDELGHLIMIKHKQIILALAVRCYKSFDILAIYNDKLHLVRVDVSPVSSATPINGIHLQRYSIKKKAQEIVVVSGKSISSYILTF